jgi:hypothetical protein
MLGATVRETQGPFPGHYRVGLNLHRDPGLPSSWKLGLGYTRPLSRHTQVELATGLSARTPAQAQRVTVGASLRHEFLL